MEGGIDTNQKQIQKRIHTLTQQINQMNHQLTFYPPGELIAHKNGPYVKFFLKSDQDFQYIPSKDQETKKLYAQKKYLQAQIQDFQTELELLRTYLTSHEKCASKAESLLSVQSNYRDLLTDAFSAFGTSAQQWLSEEYPTNPNFPDQLKYPCPSGQYVRSKSELLIATALFSHHIPFRYESELLLDGVPYYPDFTILHPLSGEIIYWEHFGLMNEPGYVNKASHKIQHYISCGIYPGMNLITTYESDDIIFSPPMIEQTIQHYFALG